MPFGMRYLLFEGITPLRLERTSLPYFRVKLSCVCLMSAYSMERKVTSYSDPIVTYSHPNLACQSVGSPGRGTQAESPVQWSGGKEDDYIHNLHCQQCSFASSLNGFESDSSIFAA